MAFEPKNATSRRSFFIKEFASSLSLADRVLLGECVQDKRIPEEERMNTNQLSDLIGEHSESFDSNDLLYEHAVRKLTKGDAIIFMTPGSFSGVQHKLKKYLEKQVRG